MPDDGPTTTGIWFCAEERELLEEFDRTLARARGADYSRSAELKEAMRVYLVVEEVLDAEGVDAAPRERDGIVRQALLDLFRE
jgi:hypothetical protein